MRSVMMSPQRPRENGWDCFTVLCLAPFPERMEWRRRRSIYGILLGAAAAAAMDPGNEERHTFLLRKWMVGLMVGRIKLI